MKALFAALAAAGAFAIGGCADPLEKPIGQEAQEKFQRGITGQGSLGPVDRADDDPATAHTLPQTRP